MSLNIDQIYIYIYTHRRPVIQETWVRSLGWEDPLEKGIAMHSSILRGEFHGQRSLVGYGP